MGEHARPSARRGFVGIAVLIALAVALWAITIAATRTACAAARDTGRAVLHDDEGRAVLHDDEGRAVLYDNAAGGGNCSLEGAADGTLYASVSTGEYAGSRACGTYLDVTGPRGSVRVQVVDRCPGCRAGELDLSRAGFARIQDPAQGVARVTYRQVRDPEPGRPLSFRVKTGSTSSWAAVQVIDHGNPLDRVELRDGGGWRALARGADDYWVSAAGVRATRFDLRVSDAYGGRATARGLTLDPGRIQHTTQKLYGEPKPPTSPTPTPTPVLARSQPRC